MYVAEQLQRNGFPPPKALRERPQLDTEDHYLLRQFLVLHRSRGHGLTGPRPITLEACAAFLQFWPQWDVLRFVEIMLLADQRLLAALAEDREKEVKDA